MECLLSHPNSEDEKHAKSYSRESCSYENMSKIFLKPRARKYGVQYSHIYYSRLQAMKPRLAKAAGAKWGKC